jgi:hypothetical protein
MALKAVYDSADQIPSGFAELYSERGGKWELTGIEGVKTQADVDRLQTALTNERNEHKTTKERLSPWLSLGKKPEEIQSQLDRVGELELLTKDKDPAAVEALVEARVKGRIAPIERERDQLKVEVGELKQENTQYKTKEKTRTIHDAVRQAATKVGLLPTAIEDALMYGERVLDVDDEGKVRTKDNVGVTPGIDPDVWLGDMKQTRSHWWGQTVGGGGSGGGGGNRFTNNPWSADHWNMTRQGEIYREDPKKAEQMAKAAGSKIGGQRPAPKK